MRVVDAERERWINVLRDPAAVRINYLRGNIACQTLIDEAVEAQKQKDAKIADDYAEGYRGGLYHYGAADKDSGRGRQEGHINAGEFIAAAIRKGGE